MSADDNSAADLGVGVERPPLRVTAAPTRSRPWDAASQRAILRRELLELSFYRLLLRANDEDSALLSQLDSEFTAFVEGGGEDDDPREAFCLRFPPMPPRCRALLSRLASRFHLQAVSFGEDDARWCAVYKHPITAARPVLRIQDFQHAASYYAPPPPPPAPQYKRARYDRREEKTGVDLQATEVPLRFEYGRWTTGAATGAAAASASSAASSCAEEEEEPKGGFECEIAECHEHILQLTKLDPPPPWEDRSRLTAADEASTAAGAAGEYWKRLLPEAEACRALPDGMLAVFASADAARAVLDAKAAAPASQPDPSGAVRLRLGEATCLASPLSALQRKPSARGAGGRGVPRALQSALRGIGGPSVGRGRGAPRGPHM